MNGLVRHTLFRWLIALLSMSGIGSFAHAAESTADALWNAHVKPLLEQRCAECHSAIRSKSGLDLSSLQSMLRGGDRGAAVLPGRPDDSPLYKFVLPGADPHMPPKGKPLSDDEARWIRSWIQKLPAGPSTPGESTPSTPATSPAPTVHPAAIHTRWTPPSDLPLEKVIDEFLRQGWLEHGITPSSPTDDASWVRRLYLDLAGRIPNPAEVQAFLKDRSRDKRARLVEALLAGPDYPRHFREIFDVVLMDRRGPSAEDQRQRNHWFHYLENAFRENRPWNETVRDLIVARPASTEQRGAPWFLYERRNNSQAIAEAIAPVVYGVQIKCAQCHDHMVAREIKQAHYWGTVAAFNRSKNVDTPQGPGIAESAIGGFVSFANLKKETQPALLAFFNGRTIAEKRPGEGEKEQDSPDLYSIPPPPEKKSPTEPAVPKFSRRAAFAEAATQDNPLLARAMVNRLWAQFLGRGLVHPVDLMDSKHPPVYPALLDWLSDDFARNGYDVKRLARALCLTRAYQLESLPLQPPAPRPPQSRFKIYSTHPLTAYFPERPKKLAEPKPKSSVRSDDIFARALEKPLSAEQLWRSLLLATGNVAQPDGAIPDFGEHEIRRAIIAQFPDLFAPEPQATLQQAMFLSNSPLIDRLVQPRNGNFCAELLADYGLDPLNKKQARAALVEMFQRILGRSPDAEEIEQFVPHLTERPPTAAFPQVLWALITSAEFQVNH